MDWKRFFRVLVCLLVVCSLLLNTISLRADASATGLIVGTAISVAAVYVVASVLIGLGISPGSTTTAFDDLVEDVCTFLEDAGTVVNGMLSVWCLTNGSYKYAVDQSLIETIRSWLFDEGTVFESFSAEDSILSSYLTLPEWNVSTYPYFVVISNPKLTLPTSYFLYCSREPVISTGTSPAIYLRSSSFSRMLYCFFSGTEKVWGDWELKYSADYPNSESVSNTYESVVFSNHDILDSTGELYFAANVGASERVVSTSEDLTLSVVASSNKTLPDGYSIWAENALTLSGTMTGEDTDENDIPVWPLGLGLTYGETQSLTQEDVWAGESNYEDAFSDTLTGTLADSTVGIFIDVLVDAITAPFEWLADTLLEGIKAIFVPSVDFLTEKVEAIRSEYAFADSIISAGELVGGTLQSLETEPPVIYIDLGAARGSYYLGGVEPFIDLRWYAEYKPTGDALISALLWIAFIWRLFIKLPGIISGMPGDFVMDGLHQIGLADRLPARSAAYEVQRIGNRQSLRKGPGK